MWARVARFVGDPADVDARVERLRDLLDSGGLPEVMKRGKFLILVDRTSGNAMGVTLFETEADLHEADALMNAGPGHAGSRSGVEFYEVPLHAL